MATSRRLFKFSAPGNESTPEPSPERKSNPEVVTSGESDFESAKESPALKTTGLRESPADERTRLKLELHPLIESLDEGRPRYDTESEQAALVKALPRYLLDEPESETKSNPLASSSYWIKPHLNQPYSPIKNLFTITIFTYFSILHLLFHYYHSSLPNSLTLRT
jgi:hypothetical protein